MILIKTPSHVIDFLSFPHQSAISKTAQLQPGAENIPFHQGQKKDPKNYDIFASSRIKKTDPLILEFTGDWPRNHDPFLDDDDNYDPIVEELVKIIKSSKTIKSFSITYHE